MKKIAFLCFVFLCTSLALTTHAQEAANNKQQETIQQKDLRLLLDLMIGEFNNYNQINFQSNDFLEPQPNTDYSQLHHFKQRINSAHLEGDWIYSQVNRVDRDGDIYRQSYLKFFISEEGRIVSQAYRLVQSDKADKKAKKIKPTDEFLNSLTAGQLDRDFGDGCNTYWRREIDQFIGMIDFNTCVIDSKYKDEKRLLFSEDIFAKSGYWGREGAYTQDGKLAFGLEAPEYYRYQRARPMSCWASVHLGDDQWEFYGNLSTHDAGGSVVFGEDRQYRLQLKQTVFPATTWSDVFELFLYRGDEEKAFAYTWTDPDAKRIAANMREVQASCKLEE